MPKYILDTSNKLWNEFKSIVPKNKKINDVLIELVEKHIKEHKSKRNNV